MEGAVPKKISIEEHILNHLTLLPTALLSEVVLDLIPIRASIIGNIKRALSTILIIVIDTAAAIQKKLPANWICHRQQPKNNSRAIQTNPLLMLPRQQPTPPLCTNIQFEILLKLNPNKVRCSIEIALKTFRKTKFMMGW